MPKISKTIKYAIATLILAALFFFADPSKLFAAFSNLTPGVIVFLLLISIAMVYISALKWSLFIEANGTRVSAIKLFNYYLLGYFINQLVPSYIGGDAVRSWYAGRHGSQHNAFAGTIMERLTGFVAMLFLGLVSLFVVPGLSPVIVIFIVLLCLGLVAVTAVALSDRLFLLIKKIPLIARHAEHLLKIQKILKDSLKNKPLLIKAMLLSFLFHIFTVFNTVACAWAIGYSDIPVLSLFAVMPLILLIGALPVTPSGLGLQEGAFFYFLVLLGASNEFALGVPLLLRAKVYVLAVLGGVVWLCVGKSKHSSGNG